jgi:signal transduction histidine kinase
MMPRSLRWRLVLATALIIAAIAGAAGLVSSFTVKRELSRFMMEKTRADAQAARRVFRETPDVDEAIRRVNAQYGFRVVVLDDRGGVVARSAELADYRITVLPKGGLELRHNNGMEILRVQGMAERVPGVGTVHFLPPRAPRRGAEPRIRVEVDRWLIAGLGAAALLAVGVMLMIFRRVFRPVEALTAGARALAGGKLETRVDVRGEDEVAELGQAFNAMAEALERNERARRNMVSDVAHELRTPLTSIRVQIEAVQDGVLEPDAKWIASIEEDAATLAHLVDDLQQLSLADAGALRLEVSEVLVAEVIERALSGLGRSGVVITRSVDPALVVRADARRLVQVVRNLLVNALAYAADTIAVSAARQGAVVELRVADDGPGVPDEEAERIFDRFYRADPSRSRSTGGAGLGLAIARQLVELHGGTVRYERPAFVIVLPG